MARNGLCMSNVDFLLKAKTKSPFLIPLEKYVKSSLPILTKCSICGYEWNVRANHLLCGDARCPICSKRKRTKENEKFKAELLLKNWSIELIGTYINYSTKVKIKCKVCGCENYVLPGNLMKQGGCKKCGGKIRRTSEEIVASFKTIHGDLYDYSKVEYKDIKIPVEIICKKHGSFLQRPDVHLSGCGCKKCFIESNSDNDTSFIQKAQKIYGNKYDYSRVKYIDTYTPVEIICKKHGSFMQRPNNHLNGNGCPYCKESLGERIIRTFFKNKNISVICQKTFKDLYDISFKNKLKYDFYVPCYKLLIEFNGQQHYSFNKHWHKNTHDFHRAVHRDWLKRRYAKKHNFNYLVISYKEINDINKILESKISALKESK